MLSDFHHTKQLEFEEENYMQGIKLTHAEQNQHAVLNMDCHDGLYKLNLSLWWIQVSAGGGIHLKRRNMGQ